MPQIIVTIDTEIGELSRYARNSFEIFVEGKVNGQEVGYQFILGLLEKYGAVGEFFVDIYTHNWIGENKFVCLCDTINRRGHRVQLHTHPSMAFDNGRPNLYQYSLEEQVEILKFGKEKIKEWIGVFPTAHRAGMYGINEDTFKALEKVGIFYDCSYFYGHENCKYQSIYKTEPFRIGNVTEIPVTVFKQVVSNRNPMTVLIKFVLQRKMGQKTWMSQQFQKLDIRHSATVSEIKEVISQSRHDAIIILFLHSFNFLDLLFNFKKREYDSIRINDTLIGDFEELLVWISKRESCKFTNFENLSIHYGQKDELIEISKKENSNVIKSLFKLFETRVLNKKYI
jgi:hypothetical protein